MNVEERTKKQEEIWSRDGRISTSTEPRPMIDWESEFRLNPTLLRKGTIVRNCHEKVISFSCGTSLIRSLFVMSTLFVMYTLFVLFGPYVFKNVPHRRT